MQSRYLFSVMAKQAGKRFAVVTLDTDALRSITGEDAPHKSEAREFVYARSRLQPTLDNGWQEGAAQAAAMSQVLAGEVPAVETIRRRWMWGSEGDSLDAERALAGDWDVAYQRSVRRVTAGHVITTIGAQFGGHAGRSAQELFWTGAQLVAAADVLEAAGYRVEAHAINVCKYGSSYPREDTGVLDLVTKRSDEPMRPDLLMAAVANADIYRSFGFTAKCYFPADWYVYGMGSTVEDRTEALAALNTSADLGLIPAIDNLMPHAYNREQAVRNVLAVLHTVTGVTV